MIPIQHALIVAGILFSIGLAGLLVRRNVLLILLSIEIMLNAANLSFIAGSSLHGNLHGQIAAFCLVVVAGVEVSIWLAVAIFLFRKNNSVDSNEIRWLKG